MYCRESVPLRLEMSLYRLKIDLSVSYKLFAILYAFSNKYKPISQNICLCTYDRFFNSNEYDIITRKVDFRNTPNAS